MSTSLKDFMESDEPGFFPIGRSTRSKRRRPAKKQRDRGDNSQPTRARGEVSRPRHTGETMEMMMYRFQVTSALQSRRAAARQ